MNRTQQGSNSLGRLDSPEPLYRSLLLSDPRDNNAYHQLGLIAYQTGRKTVAANLFGKAIFLNATVPAYHSNLGNILRDFGRFSEAVAACRAALCIKPDLVEAYSNLGNGLRDLGRFPDALRSYGLALKVTPECVDVHANRAVVLRDLRRLEEAVVAGRFTICIKPNYPGALSNMGNALNDIGRFDDAVACYGAALRIVPDFAGAHANLGNIWLEQGKLEAAARCFRRALSCRPDDTDAYLNLANTVRDLARVDDAVSLCRRAFRIRPDFEQALCNLGNLFRDRGLLGVAISYFIRALCVKPDTAEAYCSHGNTLLEQGKLTEAVHSYRRALGCKPDYGTAEANIAFTGLYRSDASLQDILERSRRWNATYIHHDHQQAYDWSPATASAHRERQPRIGFVSGDFRAHAVGFLVLPAIEGLARAGFHLTCYSISLKSDALTERFIKAVQRWRPVAGLADDALADLIRSDGIDILIDLSGHSDGNRLAVFARKPAPIQVTWVGYPATTGLAAMDYILADRYQAPPEFAAFYTEKIIRLPDSYIAFEPILDAPPVGDLPLLSNGFVTFGCFNVLKKITPEVVAVWSRILTRLPGSRLLLKTPALNCPATQSLTLQRFADQAIGSERLQLIGSTAPVEHMAWMGRADIALDSFPYAGGRTTLESLWMGLPVITLPRETFGSRHSLSYLSTLGLQELVAGSVDDYVARAVDLARDPIRLAALRAGLRARIQGSRLCDIDRFSADLGSAITTIWRRWCDGQPAASIDLG